MKKQKQKDNIKKKFQMSHLPRCRGPRGCRGFQGKPGSNGAQGKTGDRGLQGPQHGTVVPPEGPQGLVGPQGNAGQSGPQGPSWFALRGWQGKQGSNFYGAQGWDGVQGSVGRQGFLDWNGAQGSRGIQGSADFAQGPSGFDGDEGFQGPLADEVGIQGMSGPQGFVGRQQPYPTFGIQGPEGAQGPVTMGPQGSRGPQGPDGIAKQGLDGSQGPEGMQGYIGQEGSQGAQGMQGAFGAQGPTVVPPGGVRTFVKASRTATDQQNILLGQSSGLVPLLQAIVTQGSGMYVVSVQMSIQSLDTQTTDPVLVQVTADNSIILMETASFAGIRIPFFMHTLCPLVSNALITLSWQEPSTNALLGGTSIRLLLQKIN